MTMDFDCANVWIWFQTANLSLSRFEIFSAKPGAAALTGRCAL